MKILCYLPDNITFQNKLGMLTRSTGVNFQPCENESEVYTFAEKEEEKDFYLFADSKCTQFIYEFSTHYTACKIVPILLDPIQQHLTNLLNIENTESFVVAKDGEFDAVELISLLKKFKLKNNLSLEKHLAFPSIINEKEIKSSSDKKHALTMLESFVLKIGGDSPRAHQYAQRICDLADELLFYSIYETSHQVKLNPNNPIFELPDNELVKIKWGFDGDSFGISVADNSGTISKQSLLKYFYGNDKKESFADKHPGSIRSKLIFERLHHYIINVNLNKTTEIICLLRLDKKFKDFDRRLRSFHYFKNEEE